MITQSKTILGVFTSAAHADNAVAQLHENGLDVKNISIMAKDLEWAQERHGDKGSYIARGAAAGAGTGAALGALTGLLVGLGTISLPGIGPFLVSGPLAAALGLTGAAATTVTGAAGGSLAGGVVGALAGVGLPRDIAQVYEEKVREGAVILAVNVYTLEDEEDVMNIFRRNNAEHIHGVEPGKGREYTRDSHVSLQQ